MPGLEAVAAAADGFGIPRQGYGGRPHRRVGEQALQAAAIRVMLAVIRPSARAVVPVARCASHAELMPLTLDIHRIAVLHLRRHTRIFVTMISHLLWGVLRCLSLYPS